MDRVTIFVDEVPLETDLLMAQQFAMVALARLCQDVLGTDTVVSGLVLTQTNPPSLAAVIAAGSIYELESLEASQWSTLPADSAHSIVKQGILLDPKTLTFTPPTTSGYSQCFLVQAQYDDADGDAIVRPFFNPDNPDQGFEGPGNSGDASDTTRRGQIFISVKPGPASTTPNIPNPDPGFVGLWVVTLAAGQTTVAAGNISPYAYAPYIPTTIPQLPAAFQQNKWSFDNLAVLAADGVTSTITLVPLPTYAPSGTRVYAAMDSDATANARVLLTNDQDGALPVLRRGGKRLLGKEWLAGDIVAFTKNNGFWQANPIGLSLADIISTNTFQQIVANPVLYVRTDGNDATATGRTNTSADAFLTPDAALAAGTSQFNFTTSALTIQLGIPGTYKAPFNVPRGSGTINIVGDPANQGSYFLAGAGAPGQGVVNTNGAVNLIGLTLQNTSTNAHDLAVLTSSAVVATNVSFTVTSGGTSGSHIFTTGSISIGNGCRAQGNAGCLFNTDSGKISTQPNSIFTVDGNPTFSAYTALAANPGGTIALGGGSQIVGAANGSRYYVLNWASIGTNGQGQYAFPGSTAGSLGLMNYNSTVFPTGIYG